MEDKIKGRLQGLYKRQAHTTDEERVWLQPKNAEMTRSEEVLVNKHIIRELEALLDE